MTFYAFPGEEFPRVNRDTSKLRQIGTTILYYVHYCDGKYGINRGTIKDYYAVDESGVEIKVPPKDCLWEEDIDRQFVRYISLKQIPLDWKARLTCHGQRG